MKDELREASWHPTEAEVENARVSAFMRWVLKHRGVELSDYRDLWRWSVEDIEGFWQAVAGFFDLVGDGWSSRALTEERMPGAVWFPEVRTNFAENVLRPAQDPEVRDSVAILDITEENVETPLSWAELAGRVGALAQWLRELGVQPGDRVAAILPNLPEAIIGLLAAASVGAIWTINSPDLAAAASLDRLQQLEPVVLFGVESYSYNGKDYSVADRLDEVEQNLPSLKATVVVNNTGEEQSKANRYSFARITSMHEDPTFERLPFDHPLWVLFSSGTTGAPKGIVHGHGGILLEAVKGTGLNQDMGPGDIYYAAANTSWMVWNTLVNNMASGASIVTYSGSPTYGDPGRQFEVLARTGTTMFATGAAYLQLVERTGVAPREVHDLSRLRSILSTGSPLPTSTWLWVHENVKQDVHLGSDTGGTDIASGFIGSNPIEPVHAGFLQGPLLSVAVEAWNERGEQAIGEVGDLVVTRPMPSMPLFFWGDESGEKYISSYFDKFPGVWAQGDYITETVSGEFIVHGRSDATLNRQGVRIGPADIYAALTGIPEVAESLVIGVEIPGGGYYMPLFVTLKDGANQVDPELAQRIVTQIRSTTSARHVPDEIIAAPSIPVTHSAKKLEVPIKRLFLGVPAEKALNISAVANPESVEWFMARADEFKQDHAA